MSRRPDTDVVVEATPTISHPSVAAPIETDLPASALNGGAVRASAHSSTHPLPHVRLQPSRGFVSLGLKEVWAYRELLVFLVWRDVKVRYKQTALGASWAILQPLLNSVIFAFIFGRIAKLETDGIPNFLFTFCSMVPWQFFAFGLAQGANSLVSSSNLIKKVYFPRLCIPIATVLSGLIDFSIAFGILLALMPFYKVMPGLNVVFFPLFLLLAIAASLGVSLWLSALNVQYRDVRYIVGFLTQFWMLATPIAWSLRSNGRIPENLHWLLGLNPMAGVVEGFRWALLGTPITWSMVAISTVSALVMLVSGAIYFRRMEKTFADVV